VNKTGLLLAAAGAALLSAEPQSARADITVGGEGLARAEFGVGLFDVDQQKTTADFRAEYDFAAEFFYVHPLIGTELTVEGTTYTYGGFGIDIFLDPNIVLEPNGAFGFYARGSEDAKNLGSYAEFRTGAELDYRFEDHTRLGLSFHHISNAGFTQRNPGEEELFLNLSIPLDGLP
jgi:hypothetical protein